MKLEKSDSRYLQILLQFKCIGESNDSSYTYHKHILDKNTDIIYNPQTCHFSGVPISYLKNEPSEQPRLKRL
jgi:hypothetical protein